jgi:hypothetical protein
VSGKDFGASLAGWIGAGWRWAVVSVWFAALGGSAIFVFLIYWSPPDISTSVEASTEYLQFVAGDPHELLWQVGGFQLTACTRADGNVEHLNLGPNFAVKIGAGVTVNMSNQESSGQVHFELTSPVAPSATASRCSAVASVWLIGPDRTERPLYGTQVDLDYFLRKEGSASSATPLVFPLRGQVTLGKDPSGGAQTMVLAGQVSLHSSFQQKPSRSWTTLLDRKVSYIPQTLPLERGDVVLPAPAPQNESSEAKGYIRVTASQALQVGYYLRAERITVRRVGNATITLSPSVWDRLKNEPDFGHAVTALIGLFGLGKLAEDLARAVHFARREEETVDRKDKSN